MTVKSENVTRLTEGYKCTTEMKNKKIYDLHKFTCTYESMEVDLFLVQRTFLKRSFNSRFVFSKDTLEVKVICLWEVYARSSVLGLSGMDHFLCCFGCDCRGCDCCGYSYIRFQAVEHSENQVDYVVVCFVF